MRSYQDLLVWQKAMTLVEKIYRLTDKFPPREMFGIISQMRRAAVSIPSNIAEGRRRESAKEYRHFLWISYGSGAELETQIAISQRLNFGEAEDYIEPISLLNEVMRMLNALIKSFEN